MEKHEDRHQAALLSEFYQDEERAASSLSLPQSLDFKPQTNSSQANWLRRSYQHLKYTFWRIPYVLLSIVASFIPSFLYQHNSSTKETRSDRRLSPTAYLDGLRGVACFAVYIHHFVLNWFPALRNAYGSSPSDHYFLQLPIIRVIYEGQSAVATFFVISGYALSYSALSKIHANDQAGAFNTLSSSTLRRCVRIYIPCAVNTFICMLLQYNEYFIQDPLRWNNMPPRFDTFSAQFWDWWANQRIFMYPLLVNEGGELYSPPYNGHLWTIPLEIRGSFVVYGTVLAVAGLSRGWRMVVLVAWDVYLWYMGKWDLFLFVGGVVLANLDGPRHVARKKTRQDIDMTTEGEDDDEGLPLTSKLISRMSIVLPESKSSWSRISRIGKRKSAQIWKVVSPACRILRAINPYVLFFLSLWLLSFPHVPYMQWTYTLIPDSFNNLPSLFSGKDQGVRIIGSILLAYSLSLSPSPTSSPPPELTNTALQTRLYATLRTISIQTLFNNPLSQYLGRISFGFYLMHGPVLFCIGTRFLGPAWSAFEENGDLGAYVGMFLCAAVVNTIAIFWVGDWFARVVDERVVTLAGWGARKMGRRREGSGVR
ncbi:hypothetical protein VTL71DRAFT_4845 [Oculimacula yallundae]|uniref:Acyltransferase 3 domain-containing protein n=1 Tax=Oculimacula yallundae TaxID=86028 RepID=A0ABR4C4T6_9HELO